MPIDERAFCAENEHRTPSSGRTPNLPIGDDHSDDPTDRTYDITQSLGPYVDPHSR
ncbi:hypothetical protein [Pseudactinotalea sp. HY158]|uniref:hypothetical protein n=1 Tax=Pseudactinotalea sp. HY158 TaxID=2654547 RepID=UPI00129CA7C8|nr:hypothetical protein [Pseudactinotalea sp. HY158]QGH70037.1 hypothetical protein GCE65_11375 [Pseudactinotalea sp. HY158]